MKRLLFFILLVYSFCFPLKPLEGQIPSNVPKSGLVAWYPFNGNANDESGNGLNGKVDKAILTKDRFGVLNKAYYFDSSRVITIPETANKNLFPLSISLWVHIDTSNVSGIGNLFGKYVATSWNGYLIHSTRRVDSVGNVTFKIVPWYIRNANNRLLGLYGEEDFAADLIPGKWHHFVFTVGKDKGNAYLDGKLFDTHLWTGNSGQSTNPYLWQIGGKYDDWFKGNLDDIGVWNRELTSEEVKNLYDGESTTGQPCSSSPTVKDIDGNTYNTVQIGSQCWTKENLKVTKYSDGSTIPLDNSGGTAGNGSGQTWSTLKTGARTVYGHDNNNLSTYGYLYNWYAASDSRNICPSGWHVPTNGEWTTLSDFLGGSAVAGGKLKSEGALWLNNIDASNTSGFTALPSGLRNSSLGDFVLIGSEAFFWSKTDFNGWAAYNRVLKNSTSQIFRQPSDHVYSAWYQTGVSIRCIKDKVESSTSCPGTPTAKDVDGNTYNTVQIGGQCWTKENLKVTKYNDGSTIPLDNSGGTAGDGSGQTWSTLKTGARTVYGHDNNNLSTYGYLYNGYVVGDNRGICPKGWHIPSLSEWNSLINYVGGAVNAMVNLKSSDSLLWSSPNNIKGTNSSGFSALPGGLRHAGGFGYINWDALWWTSSTTGDRLHYAAMRNSVYNDRIFTFPDDKSYGFSIRCLRDSINASLKITTTNIGSTTATSVISGGTIISTDNTSVTARGVCWNTTGTPTIQDSKTTDDSGYGSFESNLTYLQPNTLYYLRAYASTPNGTFYGNEITFKTKSLDSNAVVFFTPNVNISCDSIVEIPLLAYNFKGVLGAQGSLGWDASKLKFESIASFGPTSLGLTTNDFGLIDSQKGKISFIWNSINATTVTLPDSTALFVLKFKVIDTKLTAAVVKMNNDPIEIEVFDSNFDKMIFELGTYVSNQICAKVSGNVQTSKSLNVPGVILTLSNSLGSKSAITDANGNYSFSNISLANYTLTPSKLTEAKPRNGVSTLDIGLIQAHVLNKKPFQTPYQVIAADVNGSGTITAADIILIRRFILGAETNFGGKLYSFVDKKHVFTNPLNPFPFPQSININNTQNQVVGDFIGVKLGDVNFDNTPQNFIPKASRDRKIEFVYEIITPTVSKRSNEVIYRIKSAKQQELLGMQFTLNWDSKLAELVAIEHNPLGIFLANETGDNGSLGLSWNAGSGTPKMLQENEVVFEIRVKLNARYMSVPLNINDDLLEREAFDADFKVKELSLKLENVSNTVISSEVKLNVFPNPTQGNFTLNFNSNMAERGNILLTDMLGRTLVNQEIQISKGMNNVMIDLPSNVVTGTYNLQLRTSNNFETVKILIDNNK